LLHSESKESKLSQSDDVKVTVGEHPPAASTPSTPAGMLDDKQDQTALHVAARKGKRAVCVAAVINRFSFPTNICSCLWITVGAI